MSHTDDDQAAVGVGGGDGPDVVGRDDRDTRHPDDPHPGSGHHPGPVAELGKPDAVIFTLHHAHDDYGSHSHTFTAVLGYHLTVTVADPHPRPKALAQPGTEAYADAEAGRHASADTKAHAKANTKAHASTANANSSNTNAKANTVAQSQRGSIADTHPFSDPDPDACTDTYDPGPDTDPDPDFDTVFDTKPVPYPVTHAVALTVTDPDL